MDKKLFAILGIAVGLFFVILGMMASFGVRLYLEHEKAASVSASASSENEIILTPESLPALLPDAESTAASSASAKEGVSGKTESTETDSTKTASAKAADDSIAPDADTPEKWLAAMPPDGTEIVPTDHAYSYDEMRRDLYLLKTRYPDLVRTDSLGVTADGRQIMEARIGNPKAKNHVIAQFSIHAREYINSMLAMKWLELYLMNYGTDTYNGRTYADLFSGICIHIIPMVNPDGIMISEQGTNAIRRQSLKELLHRTYLSDQKLGRTAVGEDAYFTTWKANARGVDLNKNFDVNWEAYRTGVPFASTDCYKGPSANSEAETKAVISIAQKYHVVCVLSYHSAGNTVYWDFGSDGAVYHEDSALAGMIASLTGYAKVSSRTTDLTSFGGCSDFFTLKMKIPSVTVETGEGVCPLDINKIQGILQANLKVLPSVADRYGSS